MQSQAQPPQKGPRVIITDAALVLILTHFGIVPI